MIAKFCFLDARKYLLSAIIILIILIKPINAEVEQVVLKWNPIPCNYECPKNLQKRLEKAKGVESVTINSEEGWANIKWDKNIPFSFVPLNWALRYVGVREKYLRVRVKGHIRGSGVNYSIISTGDNTNFVLFNRAVPVDPPQYINLFNPSNRILSPDIISKLEEAKKGDKVAIIEGPIFMPERSPPDPLRLVVESISIESPRIDPKPSIKTVPKSGSTPSYGTSQNF